MMFYKETNFKETQIGRIPKEWEVDALPNLMNIIDYRGRTPPFSENGIPYIGSDNIRNEKIIFDNKRYVSEDTYKKYMTRGIPNLGDILFTTEAPMGEVALVPTDFKFCFAQRLVALQCGSDFNSTFFMYMLRSKIVQKQLEAWATGTTAKGISSKNMKFIKILYSKDIEEQRKIASILSTVDEAIQKTDEIIAKTERLKKGLMQQLLTKGIGHKEFKDTEIGRIPREWKVVRLGDIGGFQYGITASALEENTGVKLLRITDITNHGMEWQEVPYCKVTATEFSKYKLQTGDVLFARIGATTGKTCYIEQPIRAVFGSYLIRFRPLAELTTRFLYYFTQSHIYWNQVNKKKEGQLKKGLNIAALSSLSFPFPTLAEQQKIAETLLTVDSKLQLERSEKTKLQRIKQGLMDLLLTGKIRIKVN